MLTLIFSCEDGSVFKINACRWRRTCVGCVIADKGALPSCRYSIKSTMPINDFFIQPVDPCLHIAAVEITAPLQYIIQQLALLDWDGEVQIIPFLKAVNCGLELILRSGQKVFKVSESFRFQQVGFFQIEVQPTQKFFEVSVHGFVSSRYNKLDEELSNDLN